MKAKTAHRLFPRALLILAWGAVLALLVGLAFWQVQRGQEKTRLLADFVASRDAPPQHEMDVDRARALLGQETVFVRACFAGHFVADHQFLLDGQMQGGQVGFDVWTPLVRPSGERLMVNRGWVAQDSERHAVAALAVGNDEREVCGTLVRFPRSGWALKPAPESESWPRVVVYPALEELEHALGTSIYPLLLLLDVDQPGGYLRSWRPVTMTPEQHYGYAVQWAALAVTWVVMTAVFWRRRNRGSGQP
jgi:cytochrome oxidase assembly protein ShyY1